MTKRNAPRVLWRGEHVLVVQRPGGTYYNRGPNYVPTSYDIQEACCSIREAWNCASRLNHVIKRTKRTHLSGRQRKAALDALVTYAKRLDKTLPALRARRVREARRAVEREQARRLAELEEERRENELWATALAVVVDMVRGDVEGATFKARRLRGDLEELKGLLAKATKHGHAIRDRIEKERS